MSLIRAFRIPQLRAASRPALIASMSSLPGSASLGSSQPLVNEEDYNNDFTSELDDAPPMPPPSAYPPSYQLNPVTYTNDLPSSPMRVKEHYSLYVSSNQNNNILTFTRPDGGPICTISSGMVGFKNKNRSTPEAAHACAMQVFKRIEKEADIKGRANMSLELKFSGYGRGREAVYRALGGTEGDNIRSMVTRLTDRTPIKIGGTRAKKARRR